MINISTGWLPHMLSNTSHCRLVVWPQLRLFLPLKLVIFLTKHGKSTCKFFKNSDLPCSIHSKHSLMQHIWMLTSMFYVEPRIDAFRFSSVHTTICAEWRIIIIDNRGTSLRKLLLPKYEEKAGWLAGWLIVVLSIIARYEL